TLEDQIFAKLNLGPDDARRFRHSGLRAANIERATLVLADAKGLANSVTAAVTKVEPALAPMAMPPGKQDKEKEKENGKGRKPKKLDQEVAAIEEPVHADSAEADSAEADSAEADSAEADPDIKSATSEGKPGGGMIPQPPPPSSGAATLCYYILVTTKKPYDRPALEGTFAADGLRRRLNGKAYVLAPFGYEILNVHFVNERLFVLADERGMRAFLERAPNADHSGPLQDVFTLIQNNQRIVAGMHTPPGLRNVPRKMEAGVGKDMGTAGFSAQTMILQADGALKGELRLHYADAAQAERARKGIKARGDRAPGLLKEAEVAL